MSNENTPEEELPIIVPWDFEDEISSISNIGMSATTVVLEQILLEPFFDARFLQESENVNSENEKI